VEDAALLMDAIAGYHPFDSHSIPKKPKSYLESLEKIPEKLKIGYSMDLGFIKALDPEIENQVLQSTQKFADLGWDIKAVKIKLRRAELSFNTLVTSGFAYDLNLKKHKDLLDDDLVKMIKAGQTYSAKDIKRAEAQRKKTFESVVKLFQEIDILITPTTACTAFDLGQMFPPTINGRGVSPVGWMSFTFPFNLTGNPAANLPCGWSNEGLPIGMQIIGKRFADLLVLQVSKAFQNLSPWQEKRPSL
jgi:aspartyl-tRNA(Asn)/glutamyl-tRNA(Gln) amidotransferase subunit A